MSKDINICGKLIILPVCQTRLHSNSDIVFLKKSNLSPVLIISLLSVSYSSVPIYGLFFFTIHMLPLFFPIMTDVCLTLLTTFWK